MPRPRKLPRKELTGPERLAAITRLLALGIVRLASREQTPRERERTGLKAGSKRSNNSTQTVDLKGKRRG